MSESQSALRKLQERVEAQQKPTDDWIQTKVLVTTIGCTANGGDIISCGLWQTRSTLKPFNGLDLLPNQDIIA